MFLILGDPRDVPIGDGSVPWRCLGSPWQWGDFLHPRLQEGLVYAVEFSHRSGRDLINVAKKRTNVIPVIEDARHPHKYRMLIGELGSGGRGPGEDLGVLGKVGEKILRFLRGVWRCWRRSGDPWRRFLRWFWVLWRSRVDLGFSGGL